MEACYAINSEYLKQHTIDDEMITYLNETAIKLLNKANLEVQNLKDIIFNWKLFIFEKNSDKINKWILGVSKLIDSEIDSIILSLEEIK